MAARTIARPPGSARSFGPLSRIPRALEEAIDRADHPPGVRDRSGGVRIVGGTHVGPAATARA